MPESQAEFERRRAVVASGETDHARWKDAANLSPTWDPRAEYAANLIPRGARVLDLGCGAMAIERFLPPYCSYTPCDLVARDERTIVCDFNAGQFPADAECDVVVTLGVLEYLTDVPAYLRKLRAFGKPLIVSYNLAGESRADRRACGWVNDFRRGEFGELLREAGFRRAVAYELGHGQILIRAEPEEVLSAPQKTVWAVSYSTAGNFGDRLGVHILDRVLPANAVVSHISLQHIDRHPEGSPDLLVLGLGNSLFDPIITPGLLTLLDKAPRKLGVFGTQYREALPRERLDPVLDRLDRWYARSEEDALIYGRGRSNVRHMGDWLIDAFPMATGTLDETLAISSREVHTTPLDRMISRIQQYRRVTSPRLHPLLCALTSAEEVAYSEQAEMDGPMQSGKFRSMLYDVFGGDRPANKMWKVDRRAVIAYKHKVKSNIATLRDDIAQALA